MMPAYRILSYLLLSTAAMSVAACNMGRDYVSPDMPNLSADVLQESNSDTFKAEQPVEDWWNTLQDKQLSGLVEKALRHNFDVKIAIANMESARATANLSELNYLPIVTAGASEETTHVSRQSHLGNIGKNQYNTYQVGFDASWELDFFGHVSAQVQGDTARFESSVANLQGVYVTVAAETARNYIELRGAQERLKIATRNAENQQETYDMVKRQVDLGRASDLDLTRAQTQLSLTQAAMPLLEAQINASIDHLGTLTGQTPDALRKELADAKPLPTLPTSIAVGDATSMLRRRPDVAAAERDVIAATADYNVNVAELYPQTTITGNLGFVATNLSNLFKSNAVSWFVQPAITWAAFDIPRVQARIDASDAAARASVATFQKTVLTALEDTDTSMVNFSHEQKRRGQLVQSAESSMKAYQLSKARYEQGMDSFIDLLDTERSMLEAQDQLALSETQAATDLIALYKALGGGWEVAANLEAKPEVPASKDDAAQPTAPVPASN